MINLIPTKEKKEIARNFYFRVISVFFFVLAFSLFVASVGLFPAYVISYSKKNIITAKLEDKKNEIMPAVDKKAQLDIKDLNDRISLIEGVMDDKYIYSQKILNEIISRKIVGIKIKKIFYEGNTFEGRKININGIASSREQLLLFREELEGSSVFKNVDLPISNFIKGQNIDFTISIITS